MHHPRKATRLPASFRARLDLPDQGLGADVWIKDVSAEGVKLLGVPHVAPDTRVLLRVGALQLAGHVRWWRDDKAGLRLDRALRDDEIAVVRHLRVNLPRAAGRWAHVSGLREMR